MASVDLHGDSQSPHVAGPCGPTSAEREIPIGHVTNGVHIHTWVSLEMAELLDRHLGDVWRLVSTDERGLGPGLSASPTASCGILTSSGASG